MLTHNTATSIGFAVVYRGHKPTSNQLIVALLRHLAEIAEGDESDVWEALWDPFDTESRSSHEEDNTMGMFELTPDIPIDRKALARGLRNLCVVADRQEVNA